MWKDRFKIGVELIDSQHKELFAKTQELLDEINGAAVKEKCAETILFLKNYCIRHFKEEEAYQVSVGYKNHEAHKELHRKFIKSVLFHEKRMTDSGFGKKEVKEFMGMLVAWLMYHIADVDQTIVKEAEQAKPAQSHGDMVFAGVCNVLSKLIGLDTQNVKVPEKHDEKFEDSIVVRVDLCGDISGHITLSYPVKFVKNMIYNMMNFVPEEIDELEISALFETSNIISGTICGQISKRKGILADITTPKMTQRPASAAERIALDTGIGIIETDIEVIYN